MKTLNRICSVILFSWTLALSVQAATVTHVPVVGAVTDTSAWFVVRTDQQASVRMMLSTDSSTWANPIYSTTATTDVQNDFFVRLRVGGLDPQTRYFYKPEVDGQLVDAFVGEFSTFPSKGDPAPYVFLFGSCQQAYDDPNSNIGGIFPKMAMEDALFFLQHGDWIYPDTTDSEKGEPQNFFALHPELIYAAYKSRYSPNFPMAQLLKKMAVDYVWDDHDWVNNNCDRSYFNFGGSNSIAVYKEAFPHYPLPNDSMGIWHKFSCGTADIFMTDNRAQRDPNMNALATVNNRLVFTANYLDDHKILGDEQMDWLISELQSSTATWKIISTGTPFNPAMRGLLEMALLLQGTAYDPLIDPATGQPVSMDFLAAEFADKWGAFPASIYKLLKAIRDNEIENVVFISGDTHNSGLDDGTNSVIPELMGGPLDRSNQQLVALSKKEFLIDIWNKGGHTYDNAVPPDLGNAYGRVSVFGGDSLKLEAVSETGNVLAQLTLTPGFLPRPVAGVVVPGGMDFGAVDPGSQGGSAVIAISTSVDTFKVLNVSVVTIKGNSQIVPLETSAALAPGEARIFQFGFIPVGNEGDTTQALISFQTNDPQAPLKLVGAQGVIKTTAVDHQTAPNMPKRYELQQNYPNPFNPITKITYAIPELGHVQIKVYDMLGRQVATLVDEKKLAGRYEVLFDANSLPSGTYLYKLTVNGVERTRKMVVMK